MAGLEETETLGDSLASEVRVSVARLARRLRQQRPPNDLGLTKMSVLSQLHRLGPASPKLLAEREQVQPQSLTRALAALEERGLVSREPHPTDGRQTVIAITAEGRDLLRFDRQRRDEWLADVIEGRLSPTEREMLRVAAKLLDALSEG
jgi:DNA-binding MarR family transcriptional regulator